MPKAGQMRGRGRVMAKAYGVSFCGNENVLKLIVVINAQLCKYTKKSYNLNGQTYGMWFITQVVTKKKVG